MKGGAFYLSSLAPPESLEYVGCQTLAVLSPFHYPKVLCISELHRNSNVEAHFCMRFSRQVTTNKNRQQVTSFMALY